MDHHYPEHDKQRLIVPKSQAIGEFIDWLSDRHDIVLAQFDGDTWEPYEAPLQRLMAEFFGIDLDKIQVEKDAMLQAMREQQG